MDSNSIVIHRRILERHQELTETGIRHAWQNAFSMRRRTFAPPVYILAAGFDLEGRLIEMLAVELDGDQGILIFHAMRLTPKAALELGLTEEKNNAIQTKRRKYPHRRRHRAFGRGGRKR